MSPEERKPGSRSPGDESTLRDPPASGVPPSIGDFRLIRKLGEGGMGVVYEAEQQNPRRGVALKVIRGGSYVDDVHVRMFRREVQTLARLRHPGIASIYESGRTPDGQHFFAMELVRGDTLDGHLRRRASGGSLSATEVQARIQLFRKICDAINYAHQRGVIHRDLKPSNILVLRETPSAPDGEAGTPDIKILDFGLARITESDLAASTLFTELGSLQGTLPYMSPEQVRGNPDEIDLRTDGYSLGVILFEMLSDELPLDVLRVPLPDAIRTIGQEPPRPLSRVWKGARRPDPDLSTIVARAMEKEPSRRYQSVAAFSDDLHRHLTGQPILARPPSTLYQLRKLIARHKVHFAFASSLIALLVGFAAVMAVQASLIARERDRANREAEAARQVSEFLVDLFKVSDPGEARGNTITAREILDRGSARIAGELQGQPLVQARMMSTIGRVYGSLGLQKQATPLLEGALRIRREILGSDDPEVARTLYDLAGFPRTGFNEEALKLHSEALEIREKALGPDHPDVGYSLWAVGCCLNASGKYDEGRQLLERARAILEKSLGPDDIGVAWCLNDLANGLEWRGDYAGARPLFERSLAIKEKTFGPEHPDIAIGLCNLGEVIMLDGDYPAARPLLERSLAISERVHPSEHPLTAYCAHTLGECLRLMHSNAEARPFLERAVAIQENLRLDGRDFALSLNRLALVLMELGEILPAEECFKRALDIREKVLGPDDLDVAISLEGYAALLRKTGRAGQAAPLEARARAIRAAHAAGKQGPRNRESPLTSRKAAGEIR